MNCKLTNADYTTYGGMKWGEGITHFATGLTTEVCSDGWIHFYTDPLLAVFFNRIDGDFPDDAVLWEFEASGEVKQSDHKNGCKVGQTVKQIPKPVISILQRVEIVILIAKHYYTEPAWNRWADKWLDGTDRTRMAAWLAELKSSEAAETLSSEAAAAWSAEAAVAAWSAAVAATATARLAARAAEWSEAVAAKAAARAAARAAAWSAEAAVAAWSAAVAARSAAGEAGETVLSIIKKVVAKGE